jgi:hypothetical protein
VHFPFADGGWSEWSIWSKATRTGIQIRKRSCDNPDPLNGGLQCTPQANTAVEMINDILAETEIRMCPAEECILGMYSFRHNQMANQTSKLSINLLIYT